MPWGTPLTFRRPAGSLARRRVFRQLVLARITEPTQQAGFPPGAAGRSAVNSPAYRTVTWHLRVFARFVAAEGGRGIRGAVAIGPACLVVYDAPTPYLET